MDNAAYRGGQDGSGRGAGSLPFITQRCFCIGRKRLTLGYNIHVCVKKLQKNRRYFSCKLQALEAGNAGNWVLKEVINRPLFFQETPMEVDGVRYENLMQ